MRFTYPSTIGPGQPRELPPEVTGALRGWLCRAGYDHTWERGDLQDILLGFRYNGERLLLHQLCPVFLWLCQHGRVWEEGE